MIQPGEVYMADFGPAGPHPVIVVSREELNRGRYALAVVCGQHVSLFGGKLSNCVPFQAGGLWIYRRLRGAV
jgi:mRNA-degrading endonuclease toxin of MazEF toxin-antitoxin module